MLLCVAVTWQGKRNKELFLDLQSVSFAQVRKIIIKQVIVQFAIGHNQRMMIGFGNVLWKSLDYQQEFLRTSQHTGIGTSKLSLLNWTRKLAMWEMEVGLFKSSAFKTWYPTNKNEDPNIRTYHNTYSFSWITLRSRHPPHISVSVSVLNERVRKDTCDSKAIHQTDSYSHVGETSPKIRAFEYRPKSSHARHWGVSKSKEFEIQSVPCHPINVHFHDAGSNRKNNETDTLNSHSGNEKELKEESSIRKCDIITLFRVRSLCNQTRIRKETR